MAGFHAYIEANGGGKYEIVANEDDSGDAQKAAQVTAALLAALSRHRRHRRLRLRIRRRASSPRCARPARTPGDIKVTAMEQTPDFFKTAKEG